MKKIVVLGPNPAWQKTLFFPDFTKGAVNRARKMEEFASGKGINFCRALKCFRRTPFVLIQFSGGDNGRKLDEGVKKADMEFVSIPVSGPTRCCTTCLDENAAVMTEVIEPSFPASADEVDALLDVFEKKLEEGSCAAFCGSLPDGTDPGLYVRAAELAAKQDLLLLIDAFRNMDEVFSAAGKVLLKINREELAKLAGIAGVEEGLKKLFSRFPSLKYAAITDGPDQAFASDGKEIAVYTLPELAAVTNPLGCGDTASAILLAEISEGKDLFMAFRSALAAASANCLNPMPGFFDPEEAAKLLPEYQIRSL